MVWTCFKNALRQKPKGSEYESESKTLKRIHAFFFFACGLFYVLVWLHNWQLLKKGSAP
jgi:hypothetical protein